MERSNRGRQAKPQGRKVQARKEAEPTIEKKLHTVLCEFTYEIGTIIKIAYDEGYRTMTPKLFSHIIAQVELMDPTTATPENKERLFGLIERAIKSTHKKWHLVKERQRDFLLNNATTLFTDIDMSNINIIQELCNFSMKDQTPLLEEEDYEMFWGFLDALICLMIQYIHIRREPYQSGGKLDYDNPSFCVDVDVSTLSKTWDITLKFPEKKHVR